MLKSLINSLNVSSLQTFTEKYSFVKHYFNNFSTTEALEYFKKPNLEDFNLTIGTSPQKLKSLREKLKSQNLNAYLLSTFDEYINEYTPLFAKRLFYLTGFSGSLGYAVITQESVALFVDGRYIQQAQEQVNPLLIDILPLSYKNIITYLKTNLTTNNNVGINSKTFSYNFINMLYKEFNFHNLNLKFLTSDLVDEIWVKQPPQPLSPINIYPVEYAGVSLSHKITQIINYLNGCKLDSLVVTALDCIAWLLNIRGNDIEYCPLTLATLIIYKDGTVKLFTNLKKILPDIKKYLEENKVMYIDSSLLEEHLTTLTNLKVGISVDSPYYYYLKLNNNSKIVVLKDNIVNQFKTTKNPIEVHQSKIAHYKDGAAFSKLILWLNKNVCTQSLSEIQIYNQIDKIKQTIDTYKGNSFSSIVAVNANAAFPHYDPTLATNSVVKKNSILLIDCGGQYLEGTTDITRTLSFQAPNAEFKYYFSLVLKGLIALTSIKFPVNTPASNLDVLAKQYLWNLGLDYNHGTGHGVGHYLNVHEEPIRFNQTCSTPLEEGMIISIEPGFYKVGHFGIRIENLVVVQKCKNKDNFYEFETLTLVPIDIKNIDFTLLTKEEILWLNNYHQKVIQNLTPYLNNEEIEQLIHLTMIDESFL